MASENLAAAGLQRDGEAGEDTRAPPASGRRISLVLAIRWPVGGIRTYLKYTYRFLDPSEFDVTLVAPDLAETAQVASDLGQFRPQVVLTAPRPGVPGFAAAIARQIARQRRPRVVHSQGLTAGVAAVPGARLFSTRHICTVHDVFLASQFRGVRGRARLAGLRLAAAGVDVLQAVGQDACRNLQEFLGASKNLAVIPNGIDLSLVDRSADARSLRQQLACGDDCFLIGFFGRFMSQKGFRHLALAVRSLAARSDLPCSPLVVAVGGGGFIQEEQEWLRAAGIIRYFHFLPFEANVVPTMRAMDVVAVPSLWEACPLLPMEAMVAGVPLVGTSCVGLREVLHGSPAVVVPPGDPDALAAALFATMVNKPSAAAQAYAGTARSRFDAAVTARLLAEQLRRLAS